jgi:hypothetical protein
MLAQRANGTPMARKINNCRREEPSAATRVPALTCKDMPGAGDENRTRAISLGSLWRCSAATCGLADLRVCCPADCEKPWLSAWLPPFGHVAGTPDRLAVATPPPNPAAAGPLGRQVLSRVGVPDHEVTSPQAPWTGSGWHEYSYGGVRGRPRTSTPMPRSRLCRLVWLAYPATWQPRLPDPSYASPALVVVPEDKSGTALAWILSLPS